MSVISKDSKQIKLYYNSNNSLGRQTYAYVKASEKKLLAIDTAKENITGTQWAEIAEGLGIELSELIDQTHPDFRSEYGDAHLKMDESGWLKVLENQPQTVANPIVLIGNRYHAIKTPSDFVKYMEPDSAGLKKPYNK